MRATAMLLFLWPALALADTPPWPEQPVLTLQPDMQQVVSEQAALEQLAEGFHWAEGPVVEPVMDLLQQVWAALRPAAWGLAPQRPRIWDV